MYVRKAFHIDMDPLFIGWGDETRWNGWHCPAFEEKAAMALMAHVNESAPKEFQITYDAETETFYVPYEDEDEKPEAVKAHLIDVTGNGPTVKVWSIGAFSWVWDATVLHGL